MKALEVRACLYPTNETGEGERTEFSCFDELSASVLHTEGCNGLRKENSGIVDVERYLRCFAKDEVREEVRAEVLDESGGLNWKLAAISSPAQAAKRNCCSGLRPFRVHNFDSLARDLIRPREHKRESAASEVSVFDENAVDGNSVECIKPKQSANAFAAARNLMIGVRCAKGIVAAGVEANAIVGNGNVHRVRIF